MDALAGRPETRNRATATRGRAVARSPPPGTRPGFAPPCRETRP
jgi:hypothetical protein